MQRNLPLLLILLSLYAVDTWAQQAERDMKKEEKIWQQLEKIAPRSVETFKQATTAMDNGETEKAVQLYEEVFKKAPDFDPVIRLAWLHWYKVAFLLFHPCLWSLS